MVFGLCGDYVRSGHGHEAPTMEVRICDGEKRRKLRDQRELFMLKFEQEERRELVIKYKVKIIKIK